MRCEGPLTDQKRSYREYSWKAEFDPTETLAAKFAVMHNAGFHTTIW
jgi:hypothetical protein